MGRRDEAPTLERLGPPKARPSGVVPAPRRKRRLARCGFAAEPGVVIADRYRITQSIGAGGMGTVYEAVDLRTGILVALKALTRVDSQGVALRRLRREAEAGVAVRSGRVCQVHYLGVEQGVPFIVMERLHGETLRERLKATGPLSVADALSLGRQLLTALHATHACGVMHRDVKPTNVFVTSPRGCPLETKLIDFGVAKLLRGRSSETTVSETTASDGVPGTLHYLAPEQILGHRPLDERVDVYAAALVLYEVLAGRRAHASGAYDEVVQSIVSGMPVPLSLVRDDVPDELDTILSRALAKDRSQRFSSAEAFHAALCEVLPTADPMRSEPRRALHPPPVEIDEPTELDLVIELEDDD